MRPPFAVTLLGIGEALARHGGPPGTAVRPDPNDILNSVPMRHVPYLDAPLPLGFAHRGGAAGGLENTMTAFGRAVGAGFRYVETDVHATVDGALVAFHDPTLDRVTDRTGRIADLPLAEVRAARIGGVERVPLLEELLGAWPELRVNVDVKADPAVDPLIDAVRRTGAVERVCVASFSDVRLARVRASLGPELATSAGPREVAAVRLRSLIGGRVRTPACAVQVPIKARGIPVVDRRFVACAHRSDLQVHVWTVDDPATMHALLDLGVDGIITDRLDVLREVYTARGAWPD